jgi:hypothetical protein
MNLWTLYVKFKKLRAGFKFEKMKKKKRGGISLE